ncbi:MAG: chemotaxis protein CheW [Chloroflexota bacterium]
MANGKGSIQGASTDLLQLITFGLGDEWYALQAFNVRGIEAEAEITPVPLSPEWLLGVCNYHGTILPIVDLSPLLQSAKKDKNARGLFLIFHWENNIAAIWVDSVDEIYEVHPSSIEPQAVAPEDEAAELLLGRVRVRDRLIGVIDTKALVKVLIEG